MIIGMFYAMGFAFAVSLAVCGFMVHAGIGDVPEGRSSHITTTPTAGGVGLIAGLGGAFFMIPQFFPAAWMPDNLPEILSLIWAVGLLGLLDDIFPIPARVKFGVIVLISALTVYIIGPVTAFPYANQGAPIPYIAGFLGSMLWIFVAVNAVNFMDGSNGMMATVMMIACLAFAVIGARFGALHAILIPVCLAAALAGFLPYNFRKDARIFSGDVGALTVGFGFAVSCLWLCAEAPAAQSLYVGPVLILPFLADVLLTMLRRAKYKENLLAPHRAHMYQRLITSGHGHTRVAVYYGAATALLAGYAYWITSLGFHTYTIFVTLPVSITIAIYYLTIRRLN